MLISNRRLKWAAFAVLALLAAILFQPTRTWLGQLVVRRVVDRDISIRQVSFHPRSSVLVAEGLVWSKVLHRQTISLQSERAWIVPRFESLLDGQIEISGAQLENVILTVTEQSPRPNRLSATNDWQALTRPIERHNLDELQADTVSLVAAKEVNQKWSQKIDAWVERSRNIVAEVHALDSGLDSGSNPLRHEAKLRASLADFERLIAEQRHLLGQFDGVRRLLQAESKQLHDSFESEMALFTPAAQEKVETPSVRQVAESLYLELAGCGWNNFARYAEVASLLAVQSHAQRPRPNYDRLFLQSGASSSFLNLNNLVVRGVFRWNAKQVPFNLQARYSMHSPSRQPVVTTSELRYRFREVGALISVLAETNTSDRQATCLELRAGLIQGYEDSSPSDILTSELIVSETQREPEPFIELQLQPTADSVVGVMKLTPANDWTESAAAKWLGEAAEACGKGQQIAIEVSVHGSWTEPRFAVTSNTPNWLVEAIQASISQAAANPFEAHVSRLRVAFTLQIEHIQALVSRAATAWQSIIDNDQPQLVEKQRELQDRLNEITGTSFASRPSDVQKR